MITRYGYDNFSVLVFTGTIIIVGGVFINVPFLPYLLYGFGSIIIAFALWFFRDPARHLPPEAHDEGVLVCPADGKVMEIIEVDEPRLIGGKAIQISIFLSPLDVHVNRMPMNGTVVFSEYKHGEYLMAFDPKSSERNEQTFVGMRNSRGAIVFKQITGFLARRIVNTSVEGRTYKAGEQFGMMKFGSRMDVIVPLHSAILVQSGQRVRGAETLLCRLP
jgi:phosphatidylserine decarboxylase